MFIFLDIFKTQNMVKKNAMQKELQCVQCASDLHVDAHHF